jgi:hypothetical protein
MTPRAQALLDELAGYGYLPGCLTPVVTRWTQDIVRCGTCEACEYLAHVGEIIERHLRDDAT